MTVTPELQAMARAYCWSENRDAIRDGEQLHAFVDAHWRDHVRGIGHALLAIRHPSTAIWDAGEQAMLAAGGEAGQGAAWYAMIDASLGEESS